MKLMCKKFALSTIAALALAAACLTASIQIVNADQVGNINTEVRSEAKDNNHQELLDLLKQKGIDGDEAELYLELSEEDFAGLLEKFKSQTDDEVKKQINTFFDELAPKQVYFN
ncbi:Uncharacterised protein [Streptococcus pseudoporcinus]|uniref:Lipoprotein n=1 Tax=Streptococcus pseudoporcinus TaxID=361101 RepID=A0A4V6L4H5_9STRE|nr:hypothetical protein [Streptococcus pseudoporcinus]VTS32057.1 Uncharacterised protein [Streptococcus pseudoporcinus]